MFTQITGAKVASYWSLEVMRVTLKKITTQAQFVSRDYMVYVRDFALSKGISAKTLVENSNADLQLLLNPPLRVSEQTFHRMGYNLFSALPNPYEGVLEFGKGMVLSLHGSLGVAIQGASNIDEVASLARQYYQTRANSRELKLVNDVDYMCLRLSEERTKFDFFFSLAALVSFEFVLEKLLSQYTLNGQCIIHQRAKEPDDFPWEKVTGYQIKFDQEYNQLMVPKYWRTLSINSIDPELATLAKSQCDATLAEMLSKDLVNEIRQKLHSLPNKNTSLKEMARLLFVSPSTLQRRLREFDTTYKDIKLEVRLTTAKKMLFDGVSNLEQISEKLGFSDASSFTKSFKTFSGHTPAAYRKEHAL